MITVRTLCQSFMEMTVEVNGTTIVEDVTDLQGFVSLELIANLREVADEMEEHNKKVGYNE